MYTRGVEMYLFYLPTNSVRNLWIQLWLIKFGIIRIRIILYRIIPYYTEFYHIISIFIILVPATRSFWRARGRARLLARSSTSAPSTCARRVS